jgi:hypothetical protein
VVSQGIHEEEKVNDVAIYIAAALAVIAITPLTILPALHTPVHTSFDCLFAQWFQVPLSLALAGLHHVRNIVAVNLNRQRRKSKDATNKKHSSD